MQEGPSGSSVLGDITFTAPAPGVSPLTLSNVFLNDLAPVPEPMTVALLVVDLGAAVGHHWRRARSCRLCDTDRRSPRTLRGRASHFSEQEDSLR